jgi:hypothetical protein
MKSKTHKLIHFKIKVGRTVNAFFQILTLASLLISQKSVAQSDSTRAMHLQLVFALDATGSMGGLIGTAKEKIWSIASSMAQSEPAPEIEVGIVFYRDRRDDFVTRVLPLSHDLDALYSKLMEIQAQGGGDAPESVNRALFDAVNDMKWSADTSVIKNIFLVGDCPPHMDYDEVQYPVTCKAAKRKGIEINTILMGNDHTAKKIWKDIAECAGGEFLEMNMQVNNFEIVSPYDAEIKTLSEELDASRIYYGEKTKHITTSKKEEADKLKSITVSESSRRADYNLMNETNKKNYYGEKELVFDIAHSKVKFEEIRDAELPEEILKIEKEKRLAYVMDLVAKREATEKKLGGLLKQREDHLAKEIDKRDKEEVESSFNSKVYEKMRSSAAKKGYKTKIRSKF